MVEIAKQLNPDISFLIGNMMDLDLPDGLFAGITAFYAIVNLPKESLPLVFREMERVLQPGGLILLAFHVGDEIVHAEELWGRHISLDFFLFPPLAIQRYLEAAGFEIEGIAEREPYAPDVEHQSQRAYVFARKPGSDPLVVDGRGHVLERRWNAEAGADGEQVEGVEFGFHP
jgi:SAM-dependent methyltransferase